MIWMALPLPGFDLICLAVPSECLFGELYLISLTCGMVFLKARVLAHFSLQFMQAHCLMSWRSTSQLSIVTPMTLSYTSREKLNQNILMNERWKRSNQSLSHFIHMTSLTLSFFLETTEVLYFKNLTSMKKKISKKGKLGFEFIAVVLTYWINIFYL